MRHNQKWSSGKVAEWHGGLLVVLCRSVLALFLAVLRASTRTGRRGRFTLPLCLFATLPLSVAAETAPTTQHIDAGPISVTLSVDRTTIRAADAVTLTLTASAPTGVAVELPAFEPDAKLGEFTIASVHDEPPVLEPASNEGGTGARTISTRRCTLEPFLPGDYTIPSLEVTWRRVAATNSDDAGARGVARTEPIVLTVESLLPVSTPPSAGANAAPADDALDPGTIRGVYVPPPPHTSWWQRWDRTIVVAGLSTCVLFSLALVGVRAIRRRKHEHAPLDHAIQNLESLRARGPAPAETAAVCHQLAAAVRTGLADRFGPSARTWTSTELRARNPQSRLAQIETGGMVNSSAELLDRLDGVRFSGQELSSPELLGLIDATLEMLERCRDAGEGAGVMNEQNKEGTAS